MGTVDKAKALASSSLDKKMVISSMVGAGLLGAVTFFAVRSGLKPLAKAAKVAKNGSAK